MTRTRTAYAVVSACARTVSGRPATADGRLVSGPVACIGWASHQSAVRSCKPVLAHRPLPRQRAAVPCPPCPPGVVALCPHYFYSFRWPVATRSRWSFDPGRDILCSLASLLRRLQWP